MVITSIDKLEGIYGGPVEAAVVKVASWVTPAYRRMIGASPFAVLATVGPEGVDCSPRGDRAGFVAVSEDGRRVMMPDRRGNNRIDSLRNIVRDPRAGLLFLMPGVGQTLRVNGRARLEAGEEVCGAFAVEGKSPRCVSALRDSREARCARRGRVKSARKKSRRLKEEGGEPPSGDTAGSREQ